MLLRACVAAAWELHMSDCGWRVLRAADHRRMPWKNGLGMTTELLVQPTDATLETFDWRLSMARIGSDGPFSTFPGIDRLLMVLEGSLTLVVDGHSHTLAPEDEAVRFAGEVAVYATLPRKAPESSRSATDLNLMVRRGKCAASLSRRVVAPHVAWPPPPTTTAIFCKTADIRADDGLRVEKLGAHDVLVLAPEATKWPRLVSDTPAELYCIEVRPLPASE
jgi:uncharacterized protein